MSLLTFVTVDISNVNDFHVNDDILMSMKHSCMLELELWGLISQSRLKMFTRDSDFILVISIKSSYIWYKILHFPTFGKIQEFGPAQ